MSSSTRLWIAVLALVAALSGCGRTEPPSVLIGLAREDLANDRLPAAEIHLKNALQQVDDPAARLMLGRVYQRGGNYPAAEKELRRALAAPSTRDEALQPLLDLMLTTGDYRALVDATAALDDYPSAIRARALVSRGTALAALADLDAADKAFRAATAIDPAFEAALVGTIRIRAARGDVDGALADAAALLKRAPASVEARILEGDILLARRRVDDARQRFATAFETAPGNARALAKLVNVEIDLAQFSQARAHLDRLVQLIPGSAVAIQLEGRLDLRQGRFTAAATAAQRSLKIAPDFLPAVALAAEAALAGGEVEQAERQARQLADRAPGAPHGARLLAATYLRMNRPDRALEVVDAAIARGHDDPSLLELGGEAALRGSDPRRAVQLFQKARDQAPGAGTIRSRLALAKLAIGDRLSGYDLLEAGSRSAGAEGQRDTVALVMARLADKDHAAALAAVDRLAGAMPGSPVPGNLRALVLLSRGDRAGARHALESALQADPAYLPATANLAALDLQENEGDRARARYRALVDRVPSSVPALLGLAALERRLGAPLASVADLVHRARAADPASVSAALAEADLLVAEQRPATAVQVIEDALAKSPEHPDLLESLARAQIRLRQRDKAVSALERHARAVAESPGLLIRNAQLHMDFQDTDGALAVLRRAQRRAPHSSAVQSALGATLIRADRYDEASEIARALVAQGDPAGHALQGDLLAARRQWAAAAEAYAKAGGPRADTTLVPRQHRALENAGRTKAAAALLERAIRQRPDDVALRMYAGEFALSRRFYGEAVEHYRVATQQDPGNVAALNNLAWSMGRAGLPGAVAVAERAFAMAPTAAPIADTLGTLLMANGSTGRAVEMLRRAVSLAPVVGEYRLHLAEALAHQGDVAQARREIDRVLRDQPSGKVADSARGLATRL